MAIRVSLNANMAQSQITVFSARKYVLAILATTGLLAKRNVPERVSVRMVFVIAVLKGAAVNSANCQDVQAVVTSIVPDTVHASRPRRLVFATRVGKGEVATYRTVPMIAIREVSAMPQ